MTLTSPRFHGLDTLRSLAIILVILHHINSYHGAGSLPAILVPVAIQGWMGVDLFFLLSGYLIGSQLFRPYLRGERPSLWGFYRNRLFRVLPAYGAVLALYLALPGWRESHNMSPTWEFLTFTENLFVDYNFNHAFSHVWSLCVEEHFYLFMPLLVLPMMRKPSLAKTVSLLGVMVLLGIFLRGYFLVHTLKPLARAGQTFGFVYMERIYYPTYSRLDGLLAGVSLALIRSFRPLWWNAMAKRGHLLLGLGLCTVASAFWLIGRLGDSVYGRGAFGIVFGFPVLSLGLALIVASALSDNGLLSRFRIPGAKLVATLAYSLYLTQKELIHLVDRFFPAVAQVGGMLWLGVYTISCLAVAAALYLCIERPFLILRDRISTS